MMIPLHTWVAFVSALVLGGVFLGWVASMNWKRALKIPPKWRSVAYVYGTTVLLLCLFLSQAAGGDMGAVGDMVIITVVCGTWTLLTHLTHAHDDETETRAAETALPVETGEGDGT